MRQLSSPVVALQKNPTSIVRRSGVQNFGLYGL